MIILYPLEDYDGFITEADCTVYLTNNVPTAQIAEYIALSGTEREVLIRQATTLIKSKITLPDTLEDNLKNACAYLVNYSVSNVMTNSDDSNNLKVKD
ncbi:MAG: hypothetical protein HRT73_10080, partial [Flavobacteriales bacterium]|nr:hypothetical protein [Flavobacteriales bacterium]